MTYEQQVEQLIACVALAYTDGDAQRLEHYQTWQKAVTAEDIQDGDIPDRWKQHWTFATVLAKTDDFEQAKQQAGLLLEAFLELADRVTTPTMAKTLAKSVAKQRRRELLRAVTQNAMTRSADPDADPSNIAQSLVDNVKPLISRTDTVRLVDPPDEPPIWPGLPPEGLFAQWRAWTDQVTDAPGVFLDVAFLQVLAAVAASRWQIPWGSGTLRPNLYSILVAGSGVRKSTALDLAKDTLDTLTSHASYLPDQVAPETLLERLSEDSQGILFASEFSATLRHWSKDRNAGMLQIMTDLYDGREQSKSIKDHRGRRKEFHVKDPIISILAATNPDWLTSSGEDIRGGFLQRFFVAVAPERDRPPMVIPKAMEVPSELTIAVQAVASRPVCQVRPPDTKSDFYPILEALQAWAEDQARHDIQGAASGFFHRAIPFTLKLAALTDLGLGNAPLTKAAVEHAANLVRYHGESLIWLLRRAFPQSHDDALWRRVQQYLQAKGGEAGRRDIFKDLHLNVSDWEKLEASMCAAGILTSSSVVAPSGRRRQMVKLIS